MRLGVHETWSSLTFNKERKKEKKLRLKKKKRKKKKTIAYMILLSRCTHDTSSLSTHLARRYNLKAGHVFYVLSIRTNLNASVIMT